MVCTKIVVKDKSGPIEDGAAMAGSVYLKTTGTGTAKCYEFVFKAPRESLSAPVQVSCNTKLAAKAWGLQPPFEFSAYEAAFKAIFAAFMTCAAIVGEAGLLRPYRRRQRGLGVLGSLLVSFLIWSPLQALGQNTFTAVTGTEVSLLKDSKEPISDVKASPGETYIKDTGAGDARRYELVYKAPGQAQDKPVEVTYKVGTNAAAKEAKAEVTVISRPLTDVRTVLPGTDTVLTVSPHLIEIDTAPTDALAVVRFAKETKQYSLAFVAPSNVEFQRYEVAYHVVGKGGKEHARFEVLVSSNPWGAGYEAAFKVLFAAFVMAAVIEWALSVVFNWRWFLRVFDATGTKTIITLIVSAVIVISYGLDVVRELINILRNTSYPSSGATWLLSALVVAGGSAGVNSLMVTLGMRSVRTAATLQDKPPAKKAWMAVQVYKVTDDVVTVDVRFRKDGDKGFGLLGKLRGLRHPTKRHWSFFRDNSRLPNYGGFALEPGVSFSLELVAKDKDDVSVGTTKVRGPYVPVEGAIIDVEETF